MTPAATSPPPAHTGVVAATESPSDTTTAGANKNLFIVDPVVRISRTLTVALISN
jgi:hypothetical protein